MGLERHSFQQSAPDWRLGPGAGAGVSDRAAAEQVESVPTP